MFGGGHVVLALLQDAVVTPGWVTDNSLIAGYGAAQAVPGPLFTFAACLGVPVAGIEGATIALVGVFLPGLLLIAGVLPFWDQLSVRPAGPVGHGRCQRAVVGLLFAALHDPIWKSAVHGPADFAVALLATTLLLVWRTPRKLAILLLCAALGAAGATI